ncbi:MAG: hypothetical protein IPH43_04080 [Xanthomonadales bacterium]|nr:hypothetical protein [Xanthomonadales bacterium]
MGREHAAALAFAAGAAADHYPAELDGVPMLVLNPPPTACQITAFGSTYAYYYFVRTRSPRMPAPAPCRRRIAIC